MYMCPDGGAAQRLKMSAFRFPYPPLAPARAPLGVCSS